MKTFKKLNSKTLRFTKHQEDGSKQQVEYKGVKAGSFLPVSVLSVVAGPADLDDVLALF